MSRRTNLTKCKLKTNKIFFSFILKHQFIFYRKYKNNSPQPNLPNLFINNKLHFQLKSCKKLLIKRNKLNTFKEKTISYMFQDTTLRYRIKLGFEEIKFPPFEDILVIGKKSPQGKVGISKLFELLVPNEFETIDVDDPKVEAIYINRNILKKIEIERVLEMLKKKVFPYISPSEILRVDFKLKIDYDTIDLEI